MGQEPILQGALYCRYSLGGRTCKENHPVETKEPHPLERLND